MAGIDIEEIERRLMPVPVVNEAEWRRIELLRTYAIEYGAFLAQLPEGREKSLAVTALEESLMWANRALAVGRRDG